MRPSRRVQNPGILRRMASTIRLSVHGWVFGLTKHGILDSPEARVHIFGVKPNRRCLPGAISTTTVNSFLDRTSVLHGIICNYGPSFMRPVLKFHAWETQTHSLITSKRNTNLRR